MPGERLSMRKIREVLRLRLGQGLPQRAVAQSLRLSQGAVHGYMARARRVGLGWSLPDGIDDIQLEPLLFPPPFSVAAGRGSRLVVADIGAAPAVGVPISFLYGK